MAEYIEREALLERIKVSPLVTNHLMLKGKSLLIDGILDLIERQPTADVVEVRHGKWIPASKKQGVNIGMKCSLCGARIKYSEFFNGNHNYCHKCGARRRLE